MMKNVLEWLEDAAEKVPEKLCYLEEGNGITFAAIRDAARRIGSRLARITDSAPIAILSGRKLETIAGFFGIVYSGHAYAPIDGMLPEQRISVILSILKPSAILADEENFSKAKTLAKDGVPVISLKEAEKVSADADRLRGIYRKMVMTDPLYVVFTSGSTGRPKGVVTSHQSLICYIESYAKVMRIDDSDIFGNQSPLDYIAAIRDIYLPIYKCASTVIIPREYFMEPNMLFEFMNRYGVTSVGWSVSAFTVPLALGAFEEIKLETLRKICFSGSVMPASCLAVWQRNLPGARFVNQYGPTEATASCTYYIVDHQVSDEEQLPIGKAYEHYRVFLLNEDFTETSDGEIGEICVSGPILALGYYNDPERTAQSFVNNPNSKGYPERIYRTGDYGRYREDGLLEFHGRMDRQIKHMGHRVELDEIEYAAGKVEGVSESVVLYHKEKETLYLFYIGTTEPRELILEMRKILPGFMVPRKVKRLTGFPRLANGKIDMNKLKEKEIKA